MLTQETMDGTCKRGYKRKVSELSEMWQKQMEASDLLPRTQIN